MNTEGMTNKQKLVFYLMDKGLANDEVSQILSDVAGAAFEQFTDEAMKLFNEEDKKAIEEAATDIDADEEVKKRFSAHSGEDATLYLEKIIEEQAASFMTDDSQLHVTQ